MREIEFRAKDRLGVWRYGDLVKREDSYHIYFDEHAFSANPETIGQYVEKKYKDDEKIFEGDIVERKLYDQQHLGIIEFSDGSWVIKTLDEKNKRWIKIHLYTDIEVHKMIYKRIGNIHDNPELIDLSKNYDEVTF